MTEKSVHSRRTRKILVFLGIVFTLVMAACNTSNDDDFYNDPYNPPSTPGTAPAPTPPEDTALRVTLEANGTQGQAPLRVTFTASVSEDATLSWYVADRQIDVDGNVLTYRFTNAGTYEVVVSARNSSGEVANDSVTITVSAPNNDPTTPTTDPSTPVDPTTPPDDPSDTSDPTTPVEPADPTPPPTDPPPTDPPPTDPPPTDPPPTDPPPVEGNRAQVEKLLGNWTLSYSIGGDSYTKNFTFNELVDLLGDGEFIAVGPGEAIAGYDLGDEFIDEGYYIYDPPATSLGISQTYNFVFTSENSISGTSYFYDRLYEEATEEFDFTGVRN